MHIEYNRVYKYKMNFTEEHNEYHQLYIIINMHKLNIANILNSRLIYDKLCLEGQPQRLEY